MEEESSLFNANYQKRNLSYQKRYAATKNALDVCLVGCFGRLVYVFVCIICLSVAGMVCIIAEDSPEDYYDQDVNDKIGLLEDFIKKYPMYYGGEGKPGDWNALNAMKWLEETMKSRSENAVDLAPYMVVHPLYIQLQKGSEIHNYTGTYRIPTVDSENHKMKEFYNRHVSKSIPLVVRGDCESWALKAGVDKNQGPGQQDEYFNELFLNKVGYDHPFSLKTEVSYTRLTQTGDETFKQRHGKNFTAAYSNFTRERNHTGKNHLYYIQNLNLARYFQLSNSTLYSKNLLTPILRKKDILLTQWSNFSRRPKKVMNEQYVCVVKGKEQFKIVSPLYRKNIYVGVFEKLRKWETPLDFFKPDFARYPFSQYVNFIDAELAAGDCMYIPAYFYVQSRTQSDESIIITQEYASHSQFVDLVFDALEDDKITADKQHNFDKKVVDFMKNFIY